MGNAYKCFSCKQIDGARLFKYLSVKGDPYLDDKEVGDVENSEHKLI